MACIIAAIFVFYSLIIYRFFACQTLRAHTPSKGSFHVSKMMKRAGISLPICVGRHSKRKYVDGDKHTNSIEGSWSHLRKHISGIHHRPSPEHLQKYLNEFEFRYNNRDKSLEAIFKKAVKQSDVKTKHSEIKQNLRPKAGKKSQKVKK